MTEESNELAVPDDDLDAGTLEVFPPARTPVTEAQATLRAHVLMIDDAWKIADVVCQTPAAPQHYRGKPKEGTVAIMYGAELGLSPMAALQKILNINGMPSLEARTMKGLLKAKGFQFRTIVKAEDEFIIHAWEPTSDKHTDPPDEIAHWTIARAKKAKFCPEIDPATGDYFKRSKKDGGEVVIGNMKYIEQPTEMLEAKGTAEVCRAIAPEILMGLPYAAEERDDWADDESDSDVERRKPTRARGARRLRERAAERAAEREKPTEVVDADDEPAPKATVTVTDPDTNVTQIVPQTGEGIIAASGASGGVASDLGEKVDTPASETCAKPETPQAEEPADDRRDDDDMPMSPQNRARGEQILNDLLARGQIESEFDRFDAVAEMLPTYREIRNFDYLTNRELKTVVDRLTSEANAGTLDDYACDRLNAAALRQSGIEGD